MRQPRQPGRGQTTDVTGVENEGRERYHGVAAGGWRVLQWNPELSQDARQDWDGVGVPEEGAPPLSL